MTAVRLYEIAYARSGDKGGSANIGVIAASAAMYGPLCRHLTAESVHTYFASMGVARVVRYELPNLHALNFQLVGVLAGGGITSLRTDAQGKALAQALLEMEIEVPDALLDGWHLRRHRADVPGAPREPGATP